MVRHLSDNQGHATCDYRETCERIRRQVSDDLALIERLKGAHERTGIIRG
jgi:hypothetical protein